MQYQQERNIVPTYFGFNGHFLGEAALAVSILLLFQHLF